MLEEKDPESQSFRIQDDNQIEQQNSQPQDHSEHGHSHGGTTKQRKHGGGWFPKNFLVYFTIAMPTFCNILQYFWLEEVLADNPFEYQLSRLWNIVLFTLAMYSYYNAITIHNKPCKSIAALEETQHFDPVYFNNIQCNMCSAWKPQRTSHCSQLNQCILKMDHYCPWIQNCVGARNHRAFLLFNIYMCCGAMTYCYRTWTYFRFLQGTEDFWQNQWFFYPFWIFTTVMLFGITAMLIGLTIFHPILIMQGLTTLDMMKGKTLKNPFLPERSNKFYNYVNYFDRGVITNIKDFFEGDIFTFWLPFANYTQNDGTVFPTNPHCNVMDIQKMLKASDANSPDLPEIQDIHQCSTNYDELIEKEKHKYKDSNFQIKDKIFEYWRDYAQEPAQKEEKGTIEISTGENSSVTQPPEQTIDDQKSDQI